MRLVLMLLLISVTLIVSQGQELPLAFAIPCYDARAASLLENQPDWHEVNGKCIDLNLDIVPWPGDLGNSSQAMVMTFTGEDNSTLPIGFQPGSGNILQNVTYGIKIQSDFGNDTFFQADLYSQKGPLVIRFEPNSQSSMGVVSSAGSSAILASQNDSVTVRSNIFEKGGYYHVRVQILGASTLGNLGSSGPVFDRYFPIGIRYPIKIEYDGHNYNATIISFNSKLSNITFDANSKQFSWTMPFDYNATKYQNYTAHSESFYGYGIYERLFVPRQLYNSYYNSTFNATINGIQLYDYRAQYKDKNVIWNPYDYKNAVPFDYVIGSTDLDTIAPKLKQADPTSLTFSLSPAVVAPEFENYFPVVGVALVIAIFISRIRRSRKF